MEQFYSNRRRAYIKGESEMGTKGNAYETNAERR